MVNNWIYERQAKDLAKELNLQVDIKLAKVQTCPPWQDCQPMQVKSHPFLRLVPSAVNNQEFRRIDHNHGFKYEISLKRNNQVFNFDFWQSVQKSYCELKSVAPTIYDVLSCLEYHTYQNTFDEFCSDYDYDNDSIRARNIYQAMCDQSIKLSRMFTSREIEQLQEIR